MSPPNGRAGAVANAEPVTITMLASLTKTDSHRHHIATAAGRGDQSAVT